MDRLPCKQQKFKRARNESLYAALTEGLVNESITRILLSGVLEMPTPNGFILRLNVS
jgi:hypothetical protein